MSDQKRGKVGGVASLFVVVSRGAENEQIPVLEEEL